MSTKIFSIVLFLLSFIFTSWKLNLFLLIPKIEFEVPEKEIKRKTIKIKTLKKKGTQDFTSTKDTDTNKTKKDIFKRIFKKKIDKKLKEKKEAKTKIIYPKDKPTFSIQNLQKGDGNYDIDENILIEQAKDIKAKLEEFNIPVDIA